MFWGSGVCGINNFELSALLYFLMNILCKSVEIILTLPLDYELQILQIGLFCFQLFPGHLAQYLTHNSRCSTNIWNKEVQRK